MNEFAYRESARGVQLCVRAKLGARRCEVGKVERVAKKRSQSEVIDSRKRAGEVVEG